MLHDSALAILQGNILELLCDENLQIAFGTRPHIGIASEPVVAQKMNSTGELHIVRLDVASVCDKAAYSSCKIDADDSLVAQECTSASILAE